MQLLKLNWMILGALQAVDAILPCASPDDVRQHATDCSLAPFYLNLSLRHCTGRLECSDARGSGLPETHPHCSQLVDLCARFHRCVALKSTPLGCDSPDCWGNAKCNGYDDKPDDRPANGSPADQSPVDNQFPEDRPSDGN
jgi:hypothetical protein